MDQDRKSLIKKILDYKARLTAAGIRPVSIQEWEKEDLLMYANSLLEQIEEMQRTQRGLSSM